MKIAYLGPPGSFSEEALHSDLAFEWAEPVPMSSIASIVRELVEGGVDKALVPTENAIAGRIEATAQALERFPRVVVEREITLAVHFDLLAVDGTEPDAIRRVVSFPPATAQCGHFLRARVPAVTIEEADSTS
ncbi:MAG: prephenate dehydratase domain-containing protein, partial [Acidimicrobiales bacterium]